MAAGRLSLVVVSWGYSLDAVASFIAVWALGLSGFSSCGSWAQ